MGPELPLILLAAFGAGLIDSMVGGGGMIQVPALFSAYPSAPPATLLGTNKVAGIFGTIGAVARYARVVQIPWRLLAPFALVCLVGAAAGAYVVTVIPPDLVRPLVPVLLTAVLLYMLRRRDFGTEHRPRTLTRRERATAVVLIAGIAFYEGFFGPGAGSFFMIVFVRLFGFDFLHSAACARALNVAANFAATLWFSSRGHVLWAVALGMAASNIAGALCGTRLAVRHGSAFVRKVFILVVGLLILKTGWDALR